jgi:hypothetical protein
MITYFVFLSFISNLIFPAISSTRILLHISIIFSLDLAIMTMSSAYAHISLDFVKISCSANQGKKKGEVIPVTGRGGP